MIFAPALEEYQEFMALTSPGVWVGVAFFCHSNLEFDLSFMQRLSNIISSCFLLCLSPENDKNELCRTLLCHLIYWLERQGKFPSRSLPGAWGNYL